ncbi:MAG: hypothetical protein J5522_06050, partial [Lachnospiraceae bacterium]|nr:hypothetical protein [Lachnospiraceae bacterium]
IIKALDGFAALASKYNIQSEKGNIHKKNGFLKGYTRYYTDDVWVLPSISKPGVDYLVDYSGNTYYRGSGDSEFYSFSKKEIIKLYISFFRNSLVRASLEELQNMDCKELVNRFFEENIMSYPRKYNQPSKGCYIATCVYGSYDCPEVWTLRRFRDYDLSQTRYGRMFVTVYYAVSPTIVHIFGKSKVIKKIWKMPLDVFVRYLRNKGYDSTEYNDRDWD